MRDLERNRATLNKTRNERINTKGIIDWFAGKKYHGNLSEQDKDVAESGGFASIPEKYRPNGVVRYGKGFSKKYKRELDALDRGE